MSTVHYKKNTTQRNKQTKRGTTHTLQGEHIDIVPFRMHCVPMKIALSVTMSKHNNYFYNQ
jgi:hypothetical protein